MARATGSSHSRVAAERSDAGYAAFFFFDFVFADATTVCFDLLLADALDLALVLREWCALRPAWRSRRFHPFAASERKDAGIAILCAGSSVTAIAAASVRSARTSAITLAG